MTRRKRAITASINNVKRAKQLKEDHTQTVEPEDDGEIVLWNDVLVEESEERREKADNKDEDFLLSPLRGPLPSQTFRPSGTPASSLWSLWRSPSTPERIPPGVGRWTTVTADAVGTYTVKGHASLCVMVSYFNNADSPGKGRACGKNVFPEDDDSSVVLSCQLII
ncbi:hypothetical protein V8E54_005339 [Elaphomyces granulatus]